MFIFNQRERKKTFNLQSYFFVDIFHIFVLTFLDGEVGGDEDDGVPGEDVVAAVGTLDKVIIMVQ